MDSKIGRFLQVDPNAGNYDNLSQYQYCNNNPLLFIDPDGKDAVVLNDKDGSVGGHGHQAVIIGDDDEGWKLYSKNGEKSSSSGGEDKNDEGVEFATFDEFLQSEENKKYDTGLKITTTKEQDEIMLTTAKTAVKKEYKVSEYNCADFVHEVITTDTSINFKKGRVKYTVEATNRFTNKKAFEINYEFTSPNIQTGLNKNNNGVTKTNLHNERIFSALKNKSHLNFEAP